MIMVPKVCRSLIAPSARRLTRMVTMSVNSFEIDGTLIEIGDVMQFSSGKSKREFAIRTSEAYAQEIKFDLWNERTSILDNIPLETPLHISFNIKGNKNEQYNRYFVNLNAWKVEEVSKSSSSYSTFPNTQESSSPATDTLNRIPENRFSGSFDDDDDDNDDDDFDDLNSSRPAPSDKKEEEIPF